MKKILQNNTIKHYLILFFILAFLFRLPTLFNDYYDVDELAAISQTKEWLAGDTPGLDFAESKLPVYHALFKAAYTISPDRGWVWVHFFTIIIIALTSLVIFLICRKLKKEEAGIIGGILYAVLISSFNSKFMATNGEIIYNLPVIAGFYFLIRTLASQTFLQKCINFFLLITSGIIASQVKFHGVILFISSVFIFLIYLPYYNGKLTKKYICILSAIFSTFILLTLIDYFTTNLFARKLASEIYGKAFYAIVDKGLNPFNLLARYVHRQGMLLIWHFIAWIPATIYLVKFIKNKAKAETLNESALMILFIFTYLMVFGGGARLYFHYFMAAYPSLCAVAGIALIKTDSELIKKIKKRFILFLLISGLFFLTWNTKDIVLKYYYPHGFQKEGKFLYWCRAILIGTWNHYLLPDLSYTGAVKYIKNNTKKNDRIFVWGDGPYIYYFSQRRLGCYSMWPKNSILKIIKAYEKNKDEGQKKENEFINTIENKKPVLFIDTSNNGLSNFKFEVTPELKKYVERNYIVEAEVNNIKMYRRKGK